MPLRMPIPIDALDLQPFTTFDPEGILLVSGSSVEKANPMTISWGMFGIMWSRPVAMVMVRNTRHTYDFITQSPDFTLNWVDTEYIEALDICGHQSGRDIEKFTTSGLHPEQASKVGSPIVAESVLTLECRTLYRESLKPEQFLTPQLHQYYPQKDWHGLFFGEIVAAAGTERFHRAVLATPDTLDR